MGYFAHDAVIVHVYGPALEGGETPYGAGFNIRAKVDTWRGSLPEPWRQLVIGPVPTVVNGDYTYAFLPDGSKEGWPDSDRGDEYRRQFMALFAVRDEDGDGPCNVVRVRFGGDWSIDYDLPGYVVTDA